MKLKAFLGSVKHRLEAEVWHNIMLHRAHRSLGTTAVDLITSMTSYPGRIATVHRTINSLLAQTVTPELIYIALASEEFPRGRASLPRPLLETLERAEGRLCLDFVKSNTRSYKKLLPAVQRFGHERAIVTVDDDVLYPATLLETLIAGALQHPRSTLGTRGVTISARPDGSLTPYLEWKQAPLDRSLRSTLLTGRGAILYPAGSLEGVENDSGFAHVAPSADDIWFKVLTLRNGWGSARVGNGREFLSSGASQGDALYKINLTHSHATSVNDLALVQTLKHFRVFTHSLMDGKLS